MKIKYQGKDEETALSTVAALLSEKGVDAKTAIVEYRGEIYSSPEALDAYDKLRRIGEEDAKRAIAEIRG